MEMCMQFLQQNCEGETFLQQIVTGYETWVHHYKLASMSKHGVQTHINHCPGPRNSKVCLLPAKWCSCCFWTL